MNKFTKGLAVCGAVLMGSMMFTGCSLTDEQQNAIDLLTSRADELVSVIDKQNKQLSKQEAAEMIELGRSRVNYMWDVSTLELNVNLYTGRTIEEAKYNRENNQNGFNFTSTSLINSKDGYALYLNVEKETDIEDEISLHKDDYKNNTSYIFDGTSITNQGELEVGFIGSSGDVFFQAGLDTVYEEDIYEITNKNGVYDFTLYTERTVYTNDNGTAEDLSDDTFTNALIFANIKVKDGKIIDYSGWTMALEYPLENTTYEKDERGNYITRYDVGVPNSISIVYISASYLYDEEVNTDTIMEIYALAEAELNK